MRKALVIILALGFVFTISSQVMAKDKCTTIQSGQLYASDGSLIETGYDKWGYNYQARMFNGYYCDAYRDADWCQPYKNERLMMKWNDAWLNNKDCDGDDLLDRHYGFDSYIGSGAWLTNHQSGSYVNWDLTGTYTLNFTCTSGCGGDYPHNMVVNEMNMNDGAFSGNGYYNKNPGYTWDISDGLVTGSEVSFKITYTGINAGYYVELDGEINGEGKLSGTAESSIGQTFTWESVEGIAIGQTCDWDYFVKIVAAPAEAYLDGDIWYTADGKEIGPVIWGQFAIIQEVENDICADVHGAQFISPIGPGVGKFRP